MTVLIPFNIFRILAFYIFFFLIFGSRDPLARGHILNLPLHSRGLLCVCVSALLSVIRTPVIGLRATLTQDDLILILILITSANALFTN